MFTKRKRETGQKARLGSNDTKKRYGFYLNSIKYRVLKSMHNHLDSHVYNVRHLEAGIQAM